MQRMFTQAVCLFSTSCPTARSVRHFSRAVASFSKVPVKPTWEPIDYESLPEVPEIDLALVEQLERISLVEFNNEAGLLALREAVKLANTMHLVNTDGVEPLDTVLENRECYLREDKVTDGNCVDDVMSNATKVEEQYFVAPPGNIPMKKRDKEHLSSVLQTDAADNSPA